MSTLNINLNDVQPLDTILTGLSALGYSGNEGLFIKVNATADGFEFAAAGGGGGGGNTFADNVFQIFDNTDNTKKLAFQASGITTGTTRTLTIPNASGTIALTSDLTSYVPYTGATQDVDLDNNGLDAKFIKIKGTGGNGHLNFKHQSSGSTAGGSESVIYADSVGNPKWKNDGNSVQNVMLENAAITGATKTKITYDAKGLVTSGADATTADIADSSNKRYVTDAQLTVIGNTSGTNSGNQTLANTSDSTSHTVTLSATGGSVQLVEGSGITLTTTGTSADGIITIASSGGTPSGVSGAVQFSNGSAFASDAANFFYDNTNDRLGLGINAPTARLHVKGSGTTFGTSSLKIQNSASSDLLTITDDGISEFGNKINVTQTSFAVTSMVTAISTGSFIGGKLTAGQVVGVLAGAEANGFGYLQGRYVNTAEQIRMQLFGNGVSIGSSTGSGWLSVGSWNQLASSRLGVPVAPTASANYGLVSLGSGAFNGSTSGFFTGVAAGTVIAVNLASGGTSDLLNMQVAGVNRFKVSSVGQVDIISTASNQLIVQSTGTAIDSRASMLFSNNRASFASVAAFLYGNTTNTTSKLGQTMADKFFIIADGANNLGMAIGTNGNVPLFLATNNSTRLTVTGDGLLAFGTGITSAFPALKRSSTDIQVRLADDTGYANIDAALYKAGGTSGFTGTGAYTNFTIVGGIITAAS